jgi:CubicO group peptidase (beta-lactamase class C family)
MQHEATPGRHLDPVGLDAAFATARRQAELGDIPFIVFGVADAAGVVRVEAATAPGSPRPIGTDAVCLLASITKPIVATAVMRLHQDGRFHLGAPLATWLPELGDDARATITAWHVLTHTTGLEESGFEEAIGGGADRAELLRRALAAPLAAPVGSRFSYATLTFDLLTLAAERALDRPFEEILRATVLDPLAMDDTTFEPGPDLEPRVAPLVIGAWQDGHPGEPLPADQALPLLRHFATLHLAGAGLFSTAADLIRFGRAMLRGGELDGERVLARPFVDLATREVTIEGLGRQEDRLIDDEYAVGWGKPDRTSPASAAAFEHGGAAGTRLLVDPGHDLVIVSLSGAWGLPSRTHDRAINGVYAALRDAPAPPPSGP